MSDKVYIFNPSSTWDSSEGGLVGWLLLVRLESMDSWLLDLGFFLPPNRSRERDLCTLLKAFFIFNFFSQISTFVSKKSLKKSERFKVFRGGWLFTKLVSADWTGNKKASQNLIRLNFCLLQACPTCNRSLNPLCLRLER